MNKIESITSAIFDAFNEHNPERKINDIIEAAMQKAFDEGMKHNETLFNPNTQAFERFTPDFKTYINEPFEYPGFTYLFTLKL